MTWSEKSKRPYAVMVLPHTSSLWSDVQIYQHLPHWSVSSAHLLQSENWCTTTFKDATLDFKLLKNSDCTFLQRGLSCIVQDTEGVLVRRSQVYSPLPIQVLSYYSSQTKNAYLQQKKSE